MAANALLLLGRLDGVLWMPAGDVIITEGSERPFCVGVGGNSGSGSGASRRTAGNTPGGGDRRSLLPLNGSMSSSSSSSAEGGGRGRGEGFVGVLCGRADKRPPALLTGLPGRCTVALSFPLASSLCSRPVSDSCSVRAVIGSLALPWWLGGLPASEAAGTGAGDASADCRALDEVRRWRMSGFDRARLALVGEANDGRFSREERRVVLSDEEGSSGSSFTDTLVVGDVLRRFAADVSIET